LQVHTPPFASATVQGKLSATSLQVRLAAVDTPETAKFGNPSQPFGDEAKQFLANAIADKPVEITLLHKDQYSRAVCMIHYGGWPFRRCASEELLKAGLGNIYRQTGAVYGDKLETFEQLEAAAKAESIGIWSLGEDAETAAEYKKRIKQEKE
jgi:endonuclease YncB( thermonuclease family)